MTDQTMVRTISYKNSKYVHIDDLILYLRQASEVETNEVKERLLEIVKCYEKIR